MSTELVINDDYDHDMNPNVLYSPQNVPGVGHETSEDFLTQGCDCQQNCDENCSCLHGLGKNYHQSIDETKRIFSHQLPTSKFILECNAFCQCTVKSCTNRLIQFGPNSHLSVRHVKNKGLGLFSKQPIIKGEFICEYAGEIIGLNEAKRRFSYQSEHKLSNYIMVVNEFFSHTSENSQIIIDPSQIGNIGRYANHSCDANLVIHPVRIESFTTPHLALFAKRDIPANEELCYDYQTNDLNNTSNQSNDKLVKCFCEALNCRQYLPYSPLLN